MNALEKLQQVIADIRANKDPLKLQSHWDLALRLISRFQVDQNIAIQAYTSKDADAFEALLRPLQTPAPKPEAKPEGPVEVTPEMREALKAFRKRLKLIRLDDESRLGNRQMTGGLKSDVDAIIPPDGYPDTVWKDLARAGVLRHTGQGFYELVPGAAL